MAQNENGTPAKAPAKPKCGIVMPISSIDGCTAEHWADVLGILKEVIDSANFEPNLVSDADDIGIIQKRIIQNLYNNEIVVVDVSAKNPNVMFELGMRLAFDKPTIIIKDDKTDYTFDTSVIEHLTYPRDLRFTTILSFRDNLKNKIQATYQKSKSDPKYSTFLKNFGQYKVAHLDEKEVSTNEFLMQSMMELRMEFAKLRHMIPAPAVQFSRKADSSAAKIDAFLITEMNRYVQEKNLTDLALLKADDVKEIARKLKNRIFVQQYFKSEEELAENIMALVPPF